MPSTRPASPPTRRLRFVPAGFKGLVRRYVSFIERDQRDYRARDPFADLPPVHEVPGSPARLGIVREFCHYHKWYVAACREMGVSYRLIDISGDDWIERLRRSECQGFLVWPSVSRRAWREMFDERLRVMESELGLVVYPGYHETWMYENKRRVRDWLLAKGVPHPRTWIFFERAAAERFIADVPLPVVVKTNLGAAHSGVWIVRDRAELRRRVRQAFGHGLLARGRYWGEAEAGFILMQEFLPDVREWRMVRIGDSYFGHPKGRLGDFHSGSGKVEWTPPERRHLDLLKHVTDLGGFTSMDVDVFETPAGKLLVNELQTVFGAGFSVDQSRVEGKAGRFVHRAGNDPWQFEPGDFARNACANARVDVLLQTLARRQGSGGPGGGAAGSLTLPGTAPATGH